MEESRAKNKGIFTYIRGKLSRFSSQFWDDIFIIAVIVLIALASFGLGRISVTYDHNSSLQIIYPEALPLGEVKGAAANSQPSISTEGEKTYVASLSGSKYHYAWCTGAKSIKEENKIWFATKEEAQIAGYEPAANCPGL